VDEIHSKGEEVFTTVRFGKGAQVITLEVLQTSRIRSFRVCTVEEMNFLKSRDPK
jgi:hypothetical protein